jgi:Na+/melibiose symporter-like transporter
VRQYYALIFIIIFFLFIPILYLKEPDASKIPMRTFHEHGLELWETLGNRTAFSLLVYVTGTGIFASMGNIASTYVQYYVIGLTNLQAGISKC